MVVAFGIHACPDLVRSGSVLVEVAAIEGLLVHCRMSTTVHESERRPVPGHHARRRQ